MRDSAGPLYWRMKSMLQHTVYTMFSMFSMFSAFSLFSPSSKPLLLPDLQYALPVCTIIENSYDSIPSIIIVIASIASQFHHMRRLFQGGKSKPQIWALTLALALNLALNLALTCSFNPEHQNILPSRSANIENE